MFLRLCPARALMTGLHCSELGNKLVALYTVGQHFPNS